MLTIQIVGSLTFLAVTALTPFIRTEFGLSSTAVGLLIVAMYFGYFLTLIPGGVLTDIFGERLMISVGLGLLGLFSIAIGLGSHLWLLGVGLFALGCGYSMIPPGTNKGVYDWFPPEQLGVSLEIKQTGVMIGGAISAASLPVLATRTDWHTAFVTVGIVSFVSLGLLAVYSRPADAVADGYDTATTVREALQSQLRGIAKVYAETNLNPLLFVGVLFGAGQFTLMAYAVLYLTEEIALSVTLAGLLYTAMQLAGVVSRILFGYIADKWFTRTKHRLLFLIGITGFVSYLVLVALPPNPPLVLVAIAVTILGALSLGYNGVYLTMANELVGPEHTGFSTSIAIASVMVGAIVTPPLFGLLTDWTDTYAFSMVLLAVLTLLAGLFSTKIDDGPAETTGKTT